MSFTFSGWPWVVGLCLVAAIAICSISHCGHLALCKDTCGKGAVANAGIMVCECKEGGSR